MRDIDYEAKPIRFANNFSPKFSQSTGRVWPGLHVSQFVVTKVYELDQPEAVLIHPVEILNVALERIGALESRKNGYVAIVTGGENCGRTVSMDGVAHLDRLTQPRQSVGRKRKGLAGGWLIPALFNERTVPIRILAVIGHVATDARDDDIHRAAPIDVNFLRQDCFNVFSMKTAWVRVHVREHCGLVDRSNTRIDYKFSGCWRLRTGALEQKQPAEAGCHIFRD